MKKFKWIPIVLVIALLISCGTGNTDDQPNKETQISVETTIEEYATTVNSETEKETETKTKKEKKTENPKTEKKDNKKLNNTKKNIALSDIPSYSNNAYTILNDNVPLFIKSEITKKSYEKYSDLDNLGRCGMVMACIGKDIMPTEERSGIGHVRPSGWQTIKYDIVDGKYLYNRCHLIGYQLTGENDNVRNLITGTRYFNVEGMLPFEDMVADYVKETNNHVMYRVTPLYKDNNLLATGVIMEGYSVEDKGAGISFNVFCYNVQPGIKINYRNGDSKLEKDYVDNDVVKKEKEPKKNKTDNNSKKSDYILNMNSYKFHYPSCYSVDQMNESNKGYFTGTREELIDQGYDPCGNCNP